jgi:hypothetical protein
MSIKSYGLALMRWIGWTVDSSRYQSDVIEESGFRQIASIISGLADISVISDSILGPPQIPYFINKMSSSGSKFDF